MVAEREPSLVQGLHRGDVELVEATAHRRKRVEVDVGVRRARPRAERVAQPFGRDGRPLEPRLLERGLEAIGIHVDVPQRVATGDGGDMGGSELPA